MSDASHDTIAPARLPNDPLTDDDWEREVLPHLPLGWEQKARELHAFERSRQIRCPADLLRGLLGLVLCVRSLRHLGCWSVLIGLADVSEADWRKRLQHARDWLGWLLCEVLATGASQSPWLVGKGLRRVLLVDGTHWRCLGKRGKVWRMHTGFDLLAGRLTEAQITGTKVAESWKLFDVQPGDLIVSDTINGYPERLGWLSDQRAFGLVRGCLNSSPLWDEQGSRINLIAWLKSRHAPAGRLCSRTVFLHRSDGRVQPVRLLALRLTPEQRQASQRRKGKKASQHGHGCKPRAETLYLAGWLVLMTNLGQDWSEPEILALYRARWHIECLFKRFKQLLQAHRVRYTHVQRAQASLLLQALAWALQDQELVAARLQFQDELAGCVPLPASALLPAPQLAQQAVASEWMLATLSVDLLRQQVQGRVSAARFRACFPRLRRFLCSSPRRRTHWFSQTWRWLTAPADADDSGAS